MSRQSSLKTVLPDDTTKEVIGWIRTGRMTLEQMVQALKARGYSISHSALGRFSQSVRGPVGIILEWAENNPKQAARLAGMLESSPNGGFQVYFPATKERKL